MQKKYRYLGSAHHLAYTSMVLGALPMLAMIFTNKGANGLTQSQTMFVLSMGGLLLMYCYKVVVSWNQEGSSYHQPQPIDTLLLCALIIFMCIASIYTVLMMVMILMRVDRYNAQPVPLEEWGITFLFLASLVIGVIALVKMLKLSRIYRRSKGGLLN